MRVLTSAILFLLLNSISVECGEQKLSGEEEELPGTFTELEEELERMKDVELPAEDSDGPKDENENESEQSKTSEPAEGEHKEYQQVTEPSSGGFNFLAMLRPNDQQEIAKLEGQMIFMDKYCIRTRDLLFEKIFAHLNGVSATLFGLFLDPRSRRSMMSLMRAKLDDVKLVASQLIEGPEEQQVGADTTTGIVKKDVGQKLAAIVGALKGLLMMGLRAIGDLMRHALDRIRKVMALGRLALNLRNVCDHVIKYRDEADAIFRETRDKMKLDLVATLQFRMVRPHQVPCVTANRVRRLVHVCRFANIIKFVAVHFFRIEKLKA